MEDLKELTQELKREEKKYNKALEESPNDELKKKCSCGVVIEADRKPLFDYLLESHKNYCADNINKNFEKRL